MLIIKKPEQYSCIYANTSRCPEYDGLDSPFCPLFNHNNCLLLLGDDIDDRTDSCEPVKRLNQSFGRYRKARINGCE